MARPATTEEKLEELGRRIDVLAARTQAGTEQTRVGIRRRVAALQKGRAAARATVLGKSVFVTGGGNSAGEAAVHLSRYASQVTMLVRHTSLGESMSDYLVHEIENASNIAIRYQTEVVDGGGRGRLQCLSLRDRTTGQTETVPAAGLFVLIGRQPLTDWLPEAIHRDPSGFLYTGPDAAGR